MAKTRVRKAVQGVRVGGKASPRQSAGAGARLRLARVAFLGSRGKWGALGKALELAQPACGVRAIEETLLQLVLFSGYPTAIEAFRVWARVRQGPSRSPAGARAPRRARIAGESLCLRIYGDRYSELRRFMRGLSPELDALMTEVGYGRVLARPGLSLATREVVTAAALAGADRPRQLRAHLEGCLRVGVTEMELHEVLRALGGAGGPARREFQRELAGAAQTVSRQGGR